MSHWKEGENEGLCQTRVSMSSFLWEKFIKNVDLLQVCLTDSVAQW